MPAHRIVALAALLAVGSAVAVLVPRPGAAQAGNPRAATVQKVFPSAVRIRVQVAGEVVRTASGVAFARDGGATYVLTNAHVVERARAWKDPVAIEVLAGRQAPRAARVVAQGQVPDADLAVLEVRGVDAPVTPLGGDEALELGEDLIVIGAPFGKGLSVAAGILSQVEYDFSESVAAPQRPRSLKTDAAIGYGSSGAGVFDVPGGRLIGLVEGYRTARVEFGKDREQAYAFDVPMPGETFVAPAARIRAFLAAHDLGRLAPGAAVAGRAAAPPPVAPAAAGPGAVAPTAAHL